MVDICMDIVDWNHYLDGKKTDGLQSISVWISWIEILHSTSRIRLMASISVWISWIEMSSSGSKPMVQVPSISVWISWIEIVITEFFTIEYVSRYLYGYRGLKYRNDKRSKRSDLSISVWISWIEIYWLHHSAAFWSVDICMDIVDWNYKISWIAWPVQVDICMDIVDWNWYLIRQNQIF